jgi:hypothetical protein
MARSLPQHPTFGIHIMADTNTLNHGAHPAAVGASYAAAFAGISLRNFYRQVELARLPRGRKLGGRTV